MNEPDSQPVRLVLVGGFLGAGKTTLLAQATTQLARRGMRVGLITNDQAAQLVDTAVLERASRAVREVSGGCFCCKFDALLEAADRLTAEHKPDVLIGEPVGSCTDLSATVLQPLKGTQGRRFRVAPFSVLVDVSQIQALVRLDDSRADDAPRRFPESVLYVYRKQLEEADLIVLNKIDTLPADRVAELGRALGEEFPSAPHLPMSALEGEGVDAWLDYVLDGAPAGQRIAAVDYDVYAEGEAMLGWLNASVRLDANGPVDWPGFLRSFLDAVGRACRAAGAEIAHVKLQWSAGSEVLAANLVANEHLPSVRGTVQGTPRHATLLINARVRTPPDDLRRMVESCLRATAGEAIGVVVEHVEHFAPARPRPTHRYDSVV